MRITYLLFAASAVFLTSLSSKPKPSAKAALKILKGFCEFVPSGNAVVDGDTVSVQAFYMSKTEMTNLDYLEFLNHLKKNGDWEKYEIAKIDTAKWNTTFNNAHMEPMASHYHDHPAYHDYPVVNISKEGAEMYCQWLSLAYDSISGGELKLSFRIPTKAEYVRASRGDNHNFVYSWGTGFVRNTEGSFLANFIAPGDESISRDPEGKFIVMKAKRSDAQYSVDGSFITAPGKSYYPNEFGFYNLNGNVAEMINDSEKAVGGDWTCPGYDIRIESVKDFNEPHPTVGFRVVATYLGPEK